MCKSATERKCSQCGGLIEPGRDVRSRYCIPCRDSDSTRASHARRRQAGTCGDCGKPIMWNAKRCNECESRRRRGQPKADAYGDKCRERIVCGSAFIPKGNSSGRFCSRACGGEWQRRESEAACQARERAERIRRLFANLRQCAVCSSAFVAAQSHQRVCQSSECRRMMRWVAAGVAIDKRCRLCGGPAAKVRSYRSMYCEACRAEVQRAVRRKAKHRREGRLVVTSKHSLKRTDTILGIQELITKAGQCCPCCGLLMTRAIDQSSDRALELDHAIPISRGGADEWPNLRCLCRKCNGLKSDFIAPHVVIAEWMSVRPVATRSPLNTEPVSLTPTIVNELE